MNDRFYKQVPLVGQFSQVADPGQYVPVPDDWVIGISDVVESTAAIAAGRYKAVNLAGAGTISAVTNELNGELRLFIFGGDGARFVVPPDKASRTAETLSRVSMWARRDLKLDLRAGVISVADVRADGFDVRVAFWQASSDVRYAMFTGGGLEWAEALLKKGAIGLAPATEEEEPDLTGLSCQWGPIQPKQGNILSLIVKPGQAASQSDFADIVSRIVQMLEETPILNPVPPNGPDVRWPFSSIGLQSRVVQRNRPIWSRRLHVLVTATLIWLMFKLGISVGDFEPDRYRREITRNTDFRKFDDGLMLTIDCSTGVVEELRALLDEVANEGNIRFGMHIQDEAIMTCVVPSVFTSDHMHFIDGAGGGYAVAARQLRSSP